MSVRKNIFSVQTISKRMTTRSLLILILIVLVIFSLISCQKEKKAEPEKLVNVRVWTAETRKIQPYLETTGTLKADEEVFVSTEVDGIVKKIYVDQGTNVGVGTLLAEINEKDYYWDVMRFDAARKQTEASLNNAKAEFKRKEELYREELITRQQFDDISTRLALAEAELDRAKAAQSISRERRARTKIYSPISGSVKEKRVSVGDFVRNGTPLLQLIKIDFLKLNFTVSEKDVSGLKMRQDVIFTVDAFPGKQFKGKVSLLYPNVEERTRSLQAEALVPNASRALKPGYFARIKIFTGAEHEAVVVPLTALLYDGSSIRIFVVNGDKAQERIIKTGNKYDEYVEVVEGIKEKEQVVVVGQNNLSEGVKVNVAR